MEVSNGSAFENMDAFPSSDTGYNFDMRPQTSPFANIALPFFHCSQSLDTSNDIHIVFDDPGCHTNSNKNSPRSEDQHLFSVNTVVSPSEPCGFMCYRYIIQPFS